MPHRMSLGQEPRAAGAAPRLAPGMEGEGGLTGRGGVGWAGRGGWGILLIGGGKGGGAVSC